MLTEKCHNCGTVAATENWGGEHDAVSLARNPQLVRRWCRRCILTTQVEFLRKLVPRLAEVEHELASLDQPQARQEGAMEPAKATAASEAP